MPPIFESRGETAASYHPGHDFAEVEFVVNGRRSTCTAEEARELIAALSAVLDDPLADTYRALRRVAALSDPAGVR